MGTQLSYRAGLRASTVTVLGKTWKKRHTRKTLGKKSAKTIAARLRRKLES